jgi:Tfp pilus assembly protein PilE
LMVVILIVGILVSLAIITYAGVQNKAYDTEAQANLHNSITAAKSYYTKEDGSFAGLDARAMQLEAQGISFRDGDAATSPNVIYISGVSATSYVLKIRSVSGAVFIANGDHLGVSTNF